MGVYINMEMPKSCKACDLLQDYDGDMYCPLNNYLNFGDIENVPDYVMDGCKLVEVPEPLGRLIDADALEAKVDHHYKHKEITRYDRDLLLHYLDVEMSPTIIPAEEGET